MPTHLLCVTGRFRTGYLWTQQSDPPKSIGVAPMSVRRAIAKLASPAIPRHLVCLNVPTDVVAKFGDARSAEFLGVNIYAAFSVANGKGIERSRRRSVVRTSRPLRRRQTIHTLEITAADRARCTAVDRLASFLALWQ